MSMIERPTPWPEGVMARWPDWATPWGATPGAGTDLLPIDRFRRRGVPGDVLRSPKRPAEEVLPAAL